MLKMQDFEGAENALSESLDIKRSLARGRPQILINTLLDLGEMNIQAGRYIAAQPYFEESETILEMYGVQNGDHYLDTMMGLAHVHYAQNDDLHGKEYVDAALEAVRSQLGEGPKFAEELNNQAEIFRLLARYSAAEGIYRNALSILESNRRSSLSSISQVINNLAITYRAMGRLSEAEGLLRRVVKLRQEQFGDRDQRTADALLNLANVHFTMDPIAHFAEGTEILNKSIQILIDLFGPENPFLWRALEMRGNFFAANKDYENALVLIKNALASVERLESKDSGQAHRIGASIGNILRLAEKVNEALPMLLGSYDLVKHSSSKVDAATQTAAFNLGLVYYDLGRYDEALMLLREARDAVRSGAAAYGLSLSSDPIRQSRRFSEIGAVFIETIYQIAHGPDAEALIEEAFTTWQLFSQNEASVAVERLGLRMQKSESFQQERGLFDTRKLTDLLQRRRILNDQIRLWYRSGSTGNREVAILSATLQSINAQIKTEIGALDATAPQLVNLYLSSPVSVAEIQEFVQSDEVVVQYAVFSETAFAWAFSKTESRFVKLPTQVVGEIDKLVDTLRCGLDRDAWRVNSGQCSQLVGVPTPTKTQQLPFDLLKSGRLFEITITPFADMIAGKRLIIVPSGSLAKFPFGTLISKLPQETTFPYDYRAAEWFGLQHSISILPSISILKTLRKKVPRSSGHKMYLGFGNPSLNGGDNDRALAKAASERQTCEKLSAIAGFGAVSKSGATQSTDKLIVNGLGQPEKIRKEPPLPESADELCEVSESLKTRGDTEVYLGERATESVLKRMDARKMLREFKIVHFSTHGLLSRETANLSGISEPALILTPPKTASEEDDGLLTASEIALLDLDADWVILSACNTASGDEETPDSYAGFARAFFYAGARSVLASHWYVDSFGSKIFLTRAFQQAADDHSLSRADGLRRASQYMVREYFDPLAAHPEYWAPFVLVGEALN
jgi:CHAT domain-containing protein/tetratricopeptide (TPR) repeat protein